MLRKVSFRLKPSDVSNRDRIYSGHLFKQGSNFSKKFLKRYFVLFEGKVLAYYSSQNNTKEPKGEVNLSHVISVGESDVKVNDDNIYQNVFQITTKDRIYILSAPDIKSMNAWIDLIRSCVFGTKIHEGWMTKQGDFVKSWKRRYFVLTSTKLLRYFEDEQQTKFKGIINVQQIQSIKEGEPVQPYWNFIVNLQTPDRVWCLNADSEQKRQEWLKMLDEGKKTINYDANAALFVDIVQNMDKTKQRIKYILDIYAKWCSSNKQFEYESSPLSLSPKLQNKISTGFKAAGSSKSKGIWEILNNDLKDYSNKHLLNDFNFLLQSFAGNRQTFVEIYRYILGKDTEKPAIPPQHSLLLMRNMRDKLFYSQYNAQRNMLFNGCDDVKEINAQCLLDRIYSYILYSYDVLMLQPFEWARIKDYDETDKLVTSNKMLKAKKAWISDAKQIFRINERQRKFMIDVNGERKQDTKEEKEKETQQPEDEKDAEDDGFAGFVEIPPNFNRLDVNFKTDEKTESEYFEFGFVELLYWDECKENEWYVTKQYENLKEEMTSNTLCCISMQQWNDLYESAACLSESDNASQYLSYDWLGDDDDNGNGAIQSMVESMVDKYGIYEYTPIKINHICSILLYCNYYQLQQILLSTYAPNVDINESVNDWKLRHGKLAHWARHLRECCQVFGKLVTEKDEFYYSINSDKIDFGKSLKINYNVPMSMTKNLFVSQSFFEFDEAMEDNVSDKRGMLLSVTKQANVPSFYVDCGWCSDFVNEEEVLILSIYPHQSRIQSMVHISYAINNNGAETVFNNYQFYMSAIADLERMITGQKASDSIGRDTKIALDEMIRFRCGERKQNDDSKQEEDEKQEQMKLVRLTPQNSFQNNAAFVISITSGNEIKETETETKTESKAEEITKKVRPKGTLKGRKDSPTKEPHSPSEIVFQLKAKRKKKVPDYVKSMFDEYCMTVRKAQIDFARMVSLKNGYRAWRDIFMNDEDIWFKISILVRLFPLLNEIRIDYISQAFRKKTVKLLIECLKCKYMHGREIKISIYRPNTYSGAVLFDSDNSGANIEDFSLQNALDKYLLKKSKIGPNFNWFCRLNESGNIPCIEIMRPHQAMERNKNLSLILDEKQINELMEMLKQQLRKNETISSQAEAWYLKRLYSGISDRFDAMEFHKKCDGIAHTISIIKSTNKCIFGAYTSMPWGRTGKWVCDKYAFLIASLHSKPKIINVKAGHEKYGMYLQSNGGPGFGKGDIKILNKADKSSKNTCNSNSFSFNIKPNELAGGKGSYFKVADYEVFQLAFY